MQEIDLIIEGFIKELDYRPIELMFKQIKQGKRLRTKLILAITHHILEENPAKSSSNLNENSRHKEGLESLENSQLLNTTKEEKSSKSPKKNSQKSPHSLKNSQIYTLCAIVELIHLASLLHDDIIDEAQLRRGARSINAEFGAKNALMLGDILYSYAFYELSKFDSFIASTLSRAVSSLAKGELMDIELSKSFNADEKAYLTMIELKTAALIEASASCAAHLAGLDTKKFAKYGKNLGLAFQLIDDILDIKSDEKTLGKPALNDFKEGKSTVCYIALFKELNYNDKQILQGLFKKELNENEQKWLDDKFKEHSILEKTLSLAKDYGLKAIKALESVQNQALIDIVQKMIDRNF